MLVLIFSYEREEMLRGLLSELKDHKVVVIDDGSDWSKINYYDLEISHNQSVEIIRTTHEGKKGFWKKWLIAQQIALGSNHDHFLFLPDDAKDVNLETIDQFINEDLDNENAWILNTFSFNDKNRWGNYNIGLPSFDINGVEVREVGYTDCAFLTNRYTLENLDINPVPNSWFDRKGKSSGVGYQMTHAFGKMGVPMLGTHPSLAYHGNHESKMNPEERIKNPLITK